MSTRTFEEMNLIPVTILTGFLGAGKTTLLNYILHGNHGLRAAVMVNDFGAINIDAQLVVGVDGDETVNLANGCICCTIRDDLLDAALRLVMRDDPPEYILVETSGVSDPAAVASTFTLPEVTPYLYVDSILTVVDAEQFRFLARQSSILAELQLEVADIVILNKVDLVSPEALDDLKRRIRRKVASARLLEATHGQIPLELVLGVGACDAQRLSRKTPADIHVHEAHPAGSAHEHHEHHDHHDHTLVFSTWSYERVEPLSFQALRQAIRRLPPTIYRVKGILHLRNDPSQRYFLQVVGKNARLAPGAPWGDEAPRTQLVFIGEVGGLDHDLLHETMESCHAAPPRRFAWLTQAFDWLRPF
jgi:G3E family GTPase